MSSRALFVFDRENWCSVFQGPEQAAAQLEINDVDLERSSIEAPSDDLIEMGNAILREAWSRAWPRRPGWLARRLHGDEPTTL